MKRIGKFLSLVIMSCCAAICLTGCKELLLFDPRGPIGETERLVIIVSFILMLIVVIPVFVMTVWFPWKYRSSNTQAEYAPKWSHSTSIELVIWTVPAIIITLLSIMVWITTHRLDPHKPLDTGGEHLEIQAVSLDWKWLFIYPDQGIATVNQLVFPVDVPLSFKLTSGTVMTSFFIPQLGSQIYAMAGMQTRLHLMADEPGTYRGQNQQFSGEGYADMNFDASAVSPAEFESWVTGVKGSSDTLDMNRYKELEKPGVSTEATHFSAVKGDLFTQIINQYSMMDMDSDHRRGESGHGQLNQTRPENK